MTEAVPESTRLGPVNTKAYLLRWVQVPLGTFDSSPAIHRRVYRQREKRPGGTLERVRARAGFIRPYGDFCKSPSFLRASQRLATILAGG